MRKNRSLFSTTNYTKLIMLYGCLQNHYAIKMPYQSKNCMLHGYEFTDDYYDDDAFNISHLDNDDDSIVYFIPTIEEDENELNVFLIAPYPPPLIGPYHYCAMPDEVYDFMSNELRNKNIKSISPCTNPMPNRN